VRKHQSALPDFSSSVVAVPPVAWDESFNLNEAANRAQIRHIEAGGVSILLYGGNANLYHFDLGRYADLIGLIADAALPDTVVIPSIGPDFGKALDECKVLQSFAFSEVMMLPTQFPCAPAGLVRGIRLCAEALGHGLILYVKRDGYLAPNDVEQLVKAGAVRFVKYAVERERPEVDPYLSDIITAIGPEQVSSGMGETPIHEHLPVLKMATYTSGAVCIAPRAAMELLRAYKTGNLARAEELRVPFLRFEQLRTVFGGIAVLHDAVTMSGIADMGPILPMLANIPAAQQPLIADVVAGLLAVERSICAAAVT
jgi:dihydrodipicolinate synthase/N-acetylneuraminate lyase